MRERPLEFYMWPFVTSIRCPSCDALWKDPDVRYGGKSFPPMSRNPESEPFMLDVFCPACGTKLPSLGELHAANRIDLPPIHNAPFICTTEDLDSFFHRTSGHTAQIWRYWVSLSYLVLRIHAEGSNTHAFVVCQGTQRIEFPRISLAASFELSPTGPTHTNRWKIEDEESGAAIECGRIGVFNEVKHLW
jgi:hypothetical protein